jgi:hypothetical protein
MTSKIWVLTWGFATAFTVVVPCRASIKLDLLQGRPVVSDVSINGQGPFRFLVDTGAQTNQIEAGLAKRLGLRPTFQVEMMTAAGSTGVAGGHVERLALGDADAANQEFLFTTLDGVRQISDRIQGVLGQEFLAKFDYLLDLKARRLEINAPAPTAGLKVEFAAVDGRMLLPTSQGALVLDSGSDATVLFRKAPGSAMAGIQTASGFAEVTRAQSIRLKIGDREFRAGDVVYLPNASATEEGLLPASTFRTIFVSNSGGYVVVD